MDIEYHGLKYYKKRVNELSQIFETNNLEGLDFNSITISKSLQSKDTVVLFSEIERALSGCWIFPQKAKTPKQIELHDSLNELSLFYICSYYMLSLELNDMLELKINDEQLKNGIINQCRQLESRAKAFFAAKKAYENSKDINALKRWANEIPQKTQCFFDVNTILKAFEPFLLKMVNYITVNITQGANISFSGIIKTFQDALEIHLKENDMQSPEERSPSPNLGVRHKLLLCQLILYAEAAILRTFPIIKRDVLPEDSVLAKYCIWGYLMENGKKWASCKPAREMVFNSLEYLIINHHSKIIYDGLGEIRSDIKEHNYQYSNEITKNLKSYKDDELMSIIANRFADYLKCNISIFPPFSKDDPYKKLTQRDVAELLGLSQQDISKIKLGKNGSIAISLMLKINKLIGLSDAYLLGKSDDPSEKLNGLRQSLIKFPRDKKK